MIPTNATEDNAAKFKCKQCDIKFLKKTNLQSHIETNHPKSIVCKLCEDIFSEIHQLEDHLQKVHKRSKRFLCGVCNTGFLMRWRLHKHLEMHKKGEAQRFCHYFNNKKNALIKMSDASFYMKSHQTAGLNTFAAGNCVNIDMINQKVFSPNDSRVTKVKMI